MAPSEDKTYSGDIVAGSLLLPESRKIADLLLRHVSPEQWHRAVFLDNILQKRSPAGIERHARLVRNRLMTFDDPIWRLIREGSVQTASQALMACAVKHSRLLGDFMDTVVRPHWQTFHRQIDAADWHRYLDRCAQIDPGVEAWQPATRYKLKQVVFRMLAEAGYIDNTRACRLLPVVLVPDIRDYLKDHGETYVLRCMEVTSL
jgi:hypothetical protein